jgi:hypothetical protein
MLLKTVIDNYKIYNEQGIYEKTFALTGLTNIDSSLIQWVGNPTSVQTLVTGGTWQNAVNGQPIADLTGDLNGKFLSVRIALDRISYLESQTVTSATVSILSAEQVIFYGTVGIPETPTYSSGFETDIYKIQLQSANALLRRRLVSEAWQNATINEVIQDIFDKYISSENITLGQVSTIDFSFDVFVAQRKYIADVLDELVQVVGATWHISPDRKFYFLVKSDFTSVSAPTHLSAIKKSVSGLDVRTVQVIAGARSRTNLQTENFTMETGTNQFIVGFPIISAPVIKINSVEASVGVKGIQSDDENVTFLWASESDNISINSNALIKPVAGDTITVEYIGVFEIEVENQNTAKINEISALTGTSGRIEKVETDTTIETYQDGDNLANSLLDKFGEVDETVTCFIDSLTDTDLLTVWNFNLPEINIVGDYIITERQISRLTDEKPAVQLTLKNKQYYTKYGTVYNKYDKNIRRLSINEKTVIIKTDSDFSPTLRLAGIFEERPLIFFPTATEFSDPLPLFYPLECMA